MCTYLLRWCASMCMYTLVIVGANAALLSFFQVHMSLEAINCCELSDSSAFFVRPLMQQRRSDDKWEVVSQSVFIFPSPITVCSSDNSTVIFSAHLLALFALLLLCLHLSLSDTTSIGRQHRNVLTGKIIVL